VDATILSHIQYCYIFYNYAREGCVDDNLHDVCRLLMFLYSTCTLYSQSRARAHLVLILVPNVGKVFPVVAHVAATAIADDYVLLFRVFPVEVIVCPVAVTAVSIGAEVKNIITSMAVVAVILICITIVLLLLNLVCLTSIVLFSMNKTHQLWADKFYLYYWRLAFIAIIDSYSFSFDLAELYFEKNC